MLDERVRFIAGVERQSRLAGLELLEARRVQCEIVGQRWQELQTNVVPGGSAAMYCEYCKVVNLNGTIDWPVTPVKDR